MRFRYARKQGRQGLACGKPQQIYFRKPGGLPTSAATGLAEGKAWVGTGGGGAAGCKRSLTNFRPVLICDEDFSSLTQKSNNVAKHNAFCGENGLEIEPFPPVVRRRFNTEG